jgi:hypothetical protein
MVKPNEAALGLHLNRKEGAARRAAREVDRIGSPVENAVEV